MMLSVLKRLCIALRFYAVGSYQEAIGDAEGASQSTMCRVISKVSKVLADHHAKDVIRFTVDEDILEEISRGFYASASK